MPRGFVCGDLLLGCFLCLDFFVQFWILVVRFMVGFEGVQGGWGVVWVRELAC